MFNKLVVYKSDFEKFSCLGLLLSRKMITTNKRLKDALFTCISINICPCIYGFTTQLKKSFDNNQDVVKNFKLVVPYLPLYRVTSSN